VSHPDSIAGRAEALHPFVCSSTSGGLGAEWLRVVGALDLATTPQLERTLNESQARLVVLDLRDLSFMDCAGVHTIVDASLRARRRGRRLVVVRGTPNVDRVFALTGSCDDVDIGDIDQIEARGDTLLRVAEEALVP
jgi:anti-sigma B factor antagonist